MKILIVEDEVYARESLVKHTREYQPLSSAEILEAENGQEAWQLFQAHRPELVLSDIRMPLLDGLELTRLISDSDIPARVVIVSGYAEFQYAQKAIHYGAAGYLLKPIATGELYATFDGLLQRQAVAFVDDASESDTYLSPNDALAELLTTRKDFTKDDFDEYVWELLKGYSVVLIRFRCGDEQALKSADVKIMQYLNSPSGGIAKCVSLSRTLEAILVKDVPNGSCQRLVDRISGILEAEHIEYQMGVSLAAMGAQGALDAFSQAEYALNSRLFKKGTVYYFEKEAARGVYANKLDTNTLNIFKIYVSGGMLSKSLHLVRVALSAMQETPEISVQSLSDAVKGIELTLSACLADCSHDICVPHIELGRYDCFEDLQNEIEYYVTRTCQITLESKGHLLGSSKNVAEMIMAYIEHNFSEDLTLKDLAENVFFMNSSYLSDLLRKKTGKNFSSCLVETRMRRALELVRESEFSITDIAGLCGYNDTSQFIQVFKKTYGNTLRRLRMEK